MIEKHNYDVQSFETDEEHPILIIGYEIALKKKQAP